MRDYPLRFLAPGLLLSLMVLAGACPAAADMNLDYVSRYNRHWDGPDEIMDVLSLGDSLVIVSSNLALTLVDLASLPPGGATNLIYRMENINARDLYIKDSTYIYVNVQRPDASHRTGFAVVEKIGDTLVRQTNVSERNVIFEKMCVSGDHLFVTAHSHGLRIYSLADPLNPSLVGRLDSGFVDAFALDVVGDTAYVADGAGGLKIVDISNPASPVIIGGEDLSTAAGTAEDVACHNGHVYLAAGGAGVAFFPNGDPSARVLYPVDVAAEDLNWNGDLLAVGDILGVRVFEAQPDGSLDPVAREVSARRPPGAIIRLTNGVEWAEGDLVLCANWNFMDVYRLVPDSESAEPDITPGRQRVRFPPAGGVADAKVYNFGTADLVVDSVTTTYSSFQCSYAGGTIAPGDSASFEITYDGNPAEGDADILFHSNDPDENPMPIQVFGNTVHLDPGEPAVDFTLPVYSRNHETGEYIEGLFTLSDHAGKVIWLQLYGSW
jgi:hypothetical protein